MSSRIAWLLLLINLLITGAGFWLSARNGFPNGPLLQVMFVVTLATMSAVGLLIISRQFQNLIGWLLITAGISASLFLFSSEYARLALSSPNRILPFGLVLAWISQWIWIVYVWPIGVGLPMLYPEGRLLSPRWRPLAWFSAVYIVLTIFIDAFTPGPLAGYEAYVNPVGIPALENFPEGMRQALDILAFPLILLAAFSLFLRFRRASGEVRAQIKWFFYAVSLLLVWVFYGVGSGLGIFPVLPSWISSMIFGLLVALLSVAIGIAILKYRLYDIDLIIRRTLVYSALTATLGLVYFGGVVLLQSIFRAVGGQQSAIAIVVSTLTIAVLFTPLRRRIQNGIDRRFYRQKYDAEKVIARFSTILRDEVDLEKLSSALLAAVEETMQPERASLWLRQTADRTT